MAIRRAGAALFYSTLFLLIGGGVAHAQPSFTVVEQHARAGNTVHFAIGGAHSRVDYEIEVADREVLQGSAVGATIAGEFVMPDLGEDERSVKIEAELHHAGKKTKAKPRIEYLGRALPPADPAPVQAPPAPNVTPTTVAPQASPPVSAPAPGPAALVPKAAATPVSPTRAARRRARRTGAVRGPVARRPHNAAKGHRERRKRGDRKARSRHPRARTAPLFDGVPEPGSGGFREPHGGFAALDAVSPPATVADATATRAADAGLPLSVLVPGLLGMAGLALTGAALHRRRTLRRR